MKNIIFVFLLVFLLSNSSFALLHDFGLNSGEREFGYALMSQSGLAAQSGYISYDYSLEKDLSFEFSLLSYRKWYLIPSDNTIQLGFVGKKKLLSLGGLSLSGVAGIGALYSPIGFGLSPNVGGVLGWKINDRLKVALPIIASIYSDPGMLVDYSAGVSFSPMTGRHLLAGIKGTMMGVMIDNAGAFNNTTYLYGGLRAEL